MLVRLDEKMSRAFSAQGFRWPGLRIVSGFRSRLLQADLNPLAPDSLHTRCPSLAADLQVGDVPASLTTLEMWAKIGFEWAKLGGRWGGRFSPPDNHHFDVPTLDIRGIGVLD